MHKKISIFLMLFSLLVFSFPCGIARAAEDIKLKMDFARYGNNILAAVTFDIPPEYHAYAHEPGGMGLPTTLAFTLENEGAMPVLYPLGVPERDIFDPKTQVNVYSGQIMLLAMLPADANNKVYAANLEMLLCSNRHCLPYKEPLTGQLPATIPPLKDMSWKTRAEELLSREGESIGAISVEEGKAPPPIVLSPQAAAQSDSSVAGDSDKNQEKTGRSQVTAPENFDLNLSPQYENADLEIYSLGQALLLGLLAGLLLNAMPCVLPVLTFKVTGILLMGNLNHQQKIRQFREHNLCFAAGIITFFTLLALLLGAADLMWGQLYQNQALLLVMLLLVFLMGLSMLGVFTLPALDLKIGESTTSPRLKSYLTGLVSTFLATPCSGPLLGGVLAWAFTQPLAILLIIFWSVGFGMALPYVLFSIWPNMVRILPRPGNWMYVFEHLLGFFLLGTALYLFSILPQEKHMQILIVLLCVSACAWLWGKFCGLNAPVARRRIFGALGMCILAGAFFWILHPAPPAAQWQEFSPDEFVSDFGRKNMLVEFTADWCPNCKFLEATVLSGKDLRSWQKNYNLELVKVDLTQNDPYAQRLLNMLGSKSIPLTAIFAKGQDADKPLVLRDIYGKNTLKKALNDILAGT